ncbi:MAG: single-stranded DNA-binding protein [Mesorhizobium sp.]|nr:single-stranded DNA-binding protein [Mesorhizobium sp.]
MSSLNKVQLLGRLGADPEVRRMPSGDPIVNMRMATSENWRDKNSGERRERTEWHTVVIFNKALCDVAEKYLKKGNLVFVEGMLATRSWEDQSGQKRYSTEIVLKAFNGELILMPQGNGGRQGASGEDDYGQTRTHSPSTGSGSTGPAGGRDLDDEIPFAPEWR